jgi:hypothetical protein
MAIFSNQATLTYNGSSTNSNIAYGEILDVLVAIILLFYLMMLVIIILPVFLS